LTLRRFLDALRVAASGQVEGLKLRCARYKKRPQHGAGGFVGVLVWLEATGLAEWVRSSSIGYPLMITLHAIGMGTMVGLALVLDARLLGRFVEIPYTSLHRYLGVAWVGFGINFLSGSALFTTGSATKYLWNMEKGDWNYIFMVKMALVILGAISAGILQNIVGRESAGWAAGEPPGKVKTIAILSIIFWTMAIVTGRLTAYI
jgi:hypothetical protein